MPDAALVHGSMLAAALRFAAWGYRVFPCVPGEKYPLTKTGHKEATCDAGQIREWWATHPYANLAVATAGLIVVDIDGADNAWLEDEPSRAEDLARAPAVQTPRGGTHHWFRQPTGKAWTCSVTALAAQVDTRANGGYVVVPPSRTAAGAYTWIPSLELAGPADNLPEPPDWLGEQLEQIDQRRSASSRARAQASRKEAEPNASILEGSRNTTLTRIAGKMRRSGLDGPELAAALHSINRNRCVPPLPDDEVERIAASVARYPAGATRVARDDADVPSLAIVDRDDDDELPQSSDPGPISPSLLQMPGFVGDVMRHTLATAPYPEPTLAFAGALSLQAALAGQKVRDALDNRTALYVLGLANSGVGKEHPRKINARILHEAGLDNLLGASFASGEGIEDRLLACPVALYQVDEIDGLMLRIATAKDARHESILNVLLQLYSASSSVYTMRTKAGQGRSVVSQPCLCLFGSAVPGPFYRSMTSRFLSNGWFARFLILECGKRGRGQDAPHRPIPTEIVDRARAWSRFQPGSVAGEPDPVVASATDVATKAFADLRVRFEDAYSECENAADDVGMALWARAYEKARRLALVWACSDWSPRSAAEPPVVDTDAAHWAGAFVEHVTRRALHMACQHANESEFEARCKRLLDVLRQWRDRHGDEWMPFWRVHRLLPWLTREHDDVCEALWNQRRIEAVEKSTSGRRGKFLRLLPPAPQGRLPAGEVA